MDKLTRFATGIEVTLASEGGKTIDDIADGLDAIATGQDGVLRQLEATHLGHEEEDWGNEYPVRTAQEKAEDEAEA